VDAPGNHSQHLVSRGVFVLRPPTVRILHSLAAAALLVTLGSAPAGRVDVPVRYLTLQLFTRNGDSGELQESIPGSSDDYRQIVTDLRDRIGTAGTTQRRLGVVFGPLSFDNTDAQLRTLIAGAFDIALATGVAVGFHIDDSMFWRRLGELNTNDNIEWLDWNRTPNTGRRLDWSAKPLRVMPQLCINSSAVKKAVAARALLIGNEMAKGLRRLQAAGHEELFVGVIAGWETQIGRDYATGKDLGYCALTNAGYGAKSPPADIDGARAKIVADFIGLWARSLVSAGVPAGKVYSHVAFMSKSVYDIVGRQDPAHFPESYLRTINFTPPAVAFCDACIPGFSTYPQQGHLEQLQDERKQHGSTSWASSEGTSLDPSQTERVADSNMEGYLGNLFNHGAVLVNVFGWGVGEADNPFRRTAEGDGAIAAYRKFLRGGTLAEAPLPAPVAPPPADLPDRVRKIQELLPAWVDKHGSSTVRPLMERLDAQLKAQHFEDAARTADEILTLLSS
jgi:hypothetical protein